MKFLYSWRCIIVGMWGFHDRRLTLRKALSNFMTSGEHRNAIYRRWRWQQTQVNAKSGEEKPYFFIFKMFSR